MPHICVAKKLRDPHDACAIDTNNHYMCVKQRSRAMSVNCLDNWEIAALFARGALLRGVDL